MLNCTSYKRQRAYMFKYILCCILSLQCIFSRAQYRKDNEHQDWTNYVRTGGHGLDRGNIDATIKDALETHLFGIEVDNDIPGRYNSFLDPEEKLEDIKLLAERAHAINNYNLRFMNKRKPTNRKEC